MGKNSEKMNRLDFFKKDVMNKISIVFFTILCMSCKQINISQHSTSISKIKERSILTKSNLSKDNLCNTEIYELNLNEISVSGIKHNATSAEIITVLGKPDKIENYDNEFSNQIHHLYYYGKSYFDLVENKIESFQITDKHLVFDKLKLTVGDNILKCKSLSLFEIKEGKIRIPIKDNDAAIILSLNENNEVKLIYHWINW